ncbi:hypothetical protein ACJRO7_026014 [Eucalyptus globulus]|uniref:Uncharacterized protein n=1 Tax=Eucalyptus globulus TaxID=34317 RepID=A0ABD3KGY4_EUCGL
MTINLNEAPADEFLEHLLGRPNFDATKIGLAGGDRSGLSLTDHLNDAPARLQPHIHPWLPGDSMARGKGGFLKPEEASRSGKRLHEGH